MLYIYSQAKLPGKPCEVKREQTSIQTQIFLNNFLCTGSVADRGYDPGCSSRIPDPVFLPSRIPDPGVKKAPDPGYGTLVSRVKKAPDPASEYFLP